jgi:ubiquinone/menaquinone biosynthesis C-methylase UbiE
MAHDHDDGHRLFAAVYDPVTWVAERFWFPRHREYLARDLRGRVLDLGAGTGATFPYLRNAGGGDLEVHAVDPDPHMCRRARARAADLGLSVEVREERAESLSYDDDSFGAVLSGLVFCTIPDLDRAMDELARVLRPGGEFRFVEHVRADGVLATVQRLLTPAWRVAAAGCNLDRETGGRFDADDRFETVETERFRGIPPIDPVLRGRLRRSV